MPKQKKYTPRSKELVYYGPHLCPKGCGGMVVMTGSAGHDDGTVTPAPVEYIFDAPHDICYPNHVYTRHRCEGGDILTDHHRMMRDNPEYAATMRAPAAGAKLTETPK